MKNPNASNLKSTILKGLRKDSSGLLGELTKNIDDDSVKTSLKRQLDAIENNVRLENAVQQQRKTLSRQIGPARKKNQDCSELIDQVAKLSGQIDEINTQIKQQVTDIENELKAGNNTQEDNSPEWPKHLTRPDGPSQYSTSDLTVTHKPEADQQAWQSFVEHTPHATVYHEAGWQHLIRNNFTHDCHYVTCTDKQGKLVGVYPMVHLKSRLFGSFTISMPYFNYGGPLANDKAVEDALLTYAASLSESLNCSHMEVRETQARPDWKSVQRKVSMILPLPDNDDQLDSQLGSKIRAQVNRAKQQGLEIQFGGSALLDSFYQVFSHNMRDLGTPVYSKQFFADILATFPDNAFLAIASRHGKPLAVGFLLGYRDKLEIPWASSIKSQNHLGANMIMYRTILKEAIQRKYQFFDFGRSTKEASTYKFKKQWGAIEHPLHWHYWTADDNKLPEINPDNPKYKLVIRIWQQLPVFVTKIIGPMISRNLP